MKINTGWPGQISKIAMVGALALGLFASPVRTGAGSLRGQGLNPGGPSQVSIGDLAWIAGRWRGTFGPHTADAVYMEPEANSIGGVGQVYQPGRTLLVELCSLVQSANGMTLYVRNFSPDLQPQEAGAPITMKLTTVTANSWEFDNTVPGQAPARTVITHTGDDTFTSRSDVYDQQGRLNSVEIDYARAM
jgi:hypothetical protein